MPALHGLDVAAELLVVVVNEVAVALLELVAQHHLGLALGQEPLRDPLVPAGDEDELRVHLQRALPLLGEAEALVRLDVRGVGLLAGVEAAADIGHRVLRNAHGNLLGLALHVPAGLLRIVVEPGPLVLAVAEPAVGIAPRPRFPEREEVLESPGTSRRTWRASAACPAS